MQVKQKIILQVYTVLLHQVKVHSNAFMFQSDTITHSSFKHWDIHKRHFFILPACTNCCLTLSRMACWETSVNLTWTSLCFSHEWYSELCWR